MNTINVLVTLSILLLLGMIGIAAYDKSTEKYSVVKDGDCYSYGVVRWLNILVSARCYSTEMEARENLAMFLKFKSDEAAHKRRDWQVVEPQEEGT